MGGAEQWCASNGVTSHASVQEGPEGAGEQTVGNLDGGMAICDRTRLSPPCH